MGTIKTIGAPMKKVLTALLLGAWIALGAWGLALFLSGEEFGTLDKLILLAWVAHMVTLGARRSRPAPQPQSRPTRTAGESRRISPSRAFGLILVAGFTLVLLSCVLIALGTLV